MNVSAIVKHHQAVTAIIAQAMSDYASSATGSSWNNACFAFEADAIFSALSRAGYHIIGPGEQTVTTEMVEAAQRIRDVAMRQTIAARLPECGEFGGIAQDADWLVDALKAAMEAKE